MCAAKVKVLSDQVIVRYSDVVLGRGQGVYELRDFDPEIDVFGALPSNLIGNISCVTLDLGEYVGYATVRTRKHDTAIDVNAAYSSIGIGQQFAGTGSSIILDETYGYGDSGPVPVVDSDGAVLAIVTHQSPNRRK